MALSQAKILDDPITPPDGPYKLFQSDSPSVQTEHPTIENGVLKIEHGDGSVTIDFDPKPDQLDDGDDAFGANLALEMSDDELSTISSDLIDGITRDEDSRRDWLSTRARGISLLGLVLKTPQSGTGATVAGISSVDHPLILEATVNFQATARAELLPAAGPVKVRNDAPMMPKEELQKTNAQEQLKKSLSGQDSDAQALERDLNHYLTVTAPEYVPDTDRMLFYIGFGGDGFKKVYNCPLRRRPVSESVDAEDLLVSNGATDL